MGHIFHEHNFVFLGDENVPLHENFDLTKKEILDIIPPHKKYRSLRRTLYIVLFKTTEKREIDEIKTFVKEHLSEDALKKYKEQFKGICNFEDIYESLDIHCVDLHTTGLLKMELAAIIYLHNLNN